MRQERFEAQHGELWRSLEAWLHGDPVMNDEDVPAAYRCLCHHVALARERCYAPVLHERLQSLALSMHQRLYAGSDGGRGLWRFFAQDFPRLVRRECSVVITASVLLFGSWVAAFLVVRRNPDLVNLVLSPSQAAEYARMYDPAARAVAGASGEGTSGPMRDVAMFGHYIWNNIGIDFQIFGSGLVLGIGAIFALLFNGIHGGVVMAHLTNQGYIATFYGFVSGHSSFELIGAALSGAAGMRLGLALVRPGRRSRREALREAGKSGARLVMGAASMTFIAAAIEGFWSANTLVPWKVKLGIGIALWTLLVAYFLFAGRHGRSRERGRPW